jgi:hypothetical protein
MSKSWKLSNHEKNIRIDITGTLTPEGAVHLSWYDLNSVLVFRNMRFYISPSPVCDLVLGARSLTDKNLIQYPRSPKLYIG